jgi:Fe-S cluster assembly protein SufD
MNVASAGVLDRLAPPSPPSPRAERGRAWFAAHGFPTTRDEAWRYTPVDDIVGALGAATPAPDSSSEVTRSVVDDLAGDHGGPRLVFVNGVFDPRASDAEVAVDGLWLGNRDGLHTRPPSARTAEDQPADGFHALNWAAGRDVAAVVVAAHAQIDEPVHVVHIAAPGEGTTANHPRTVVLVGPGGRIHLIESFVGLPGSSITNASARLVAGAGSTITHHRIQDEGAATIHIGRTAIDQSAGSTVRATSIMTGGRIARNAIDIRFTGAGARADIDGLYLPRGDQRHDNVITVDHRASHCTSTQRFTGIIDDHARGSFSGHVLVRPGTTGTDARQSNRNLVLAPTAQADTRPWLEILADDVRCTHGATVGRLDDEALFYLRSRGIPLEQSRAILVAAFAAEVIDAITPASLRDRVAASSLAPRDGP